MCACVKLELIELCLHSVWFLRNKGQENNFFLIGRRCIRLSFVEVLSHRIVNGRHMCIL